MIKKTPIIDVNTGKIIKDWDFSKKRLNWQKQREETYTWYVDTSYTHGEENMLSVSLGSETTTLIGCDFEFTGTVQEFVEKVKRDFPDVTIIELHPDAPSIVEEQLEKHFEIY
jgi:hypothetical protein